MFPFACLPAAQASQRSEPELAVRALGKCEDAIVNETIGCGPMSEATILVYGGAGATCQASVMGGIQTKEPRPSLSVDADFVPIPVQPLFRPEVRPVGPVETERTFVGGSAGNPDVSIAILGNTGREHCTVIDPLDSLDVPVRGTYLYTLVRGDPNAAVISFEDLMDSVLARTRRVLPVLPKLARCMVQVQAMPRCGPEIAVGSKLEPCNLR